MKVKLDFVTNSSSTCYVLSSNVIGHLPRLSGNYEKLKKFYKEQEFLYEGYAHITILGNEEDAYDNATPVYNVNLSLDDTIYYDENDDERFITIFHLLIDLLNPWWNSIENVTKEFIETILFKQLKENISPSQLSYFSCASSVSGDGWNGGDPLGPSHKYTYEYELHKAETKMGILNIYDSKIISEVNSIEQPLNLNQVLLDNINTKGLNLGGTK